MLQYYLLEQFRSSMYELAPSQTSGVLLPAACLQLSFNTCGYSYLIASVNLSFCGFVPFLSVISALSEHSLPEAILA